MIEIFLYGYKGRPLTAMEGSEVHRRWPIIEVESNGLEIVRISRENIPDKNAELQRLCDFFQSYYCQWGKFGDHGDIIKLRKEVTKNKCTYHVNYIGRCAYHKPTLAADILPFFRNKDGKTFFVGITRKNDPGKGKLALIGGIRDKIVSHFETAAEACLREAKEEIGLILRTYHYKALLDRNSLKIPVIVDIDNASIYSELCFICTGGTSDEEINHYTGLKRVDETSAWLLPVNMPDVTEEKIRQLLKAGDDAKELVVIDMDTYYSSGLPALNFGIKHHQEIFYLASLLA